MNCQGAQPHLQKIQLSNIEYKSNIEILDKRIECSDQHLGAVHPLLSKKDVKFIKIGTIILISMMTLALMMNI